MLIVTPSFADASIMLCLCGIVALKVYLEKSKEVQDIKTIVSKQNEVIQTMAVEIAKVKGLAESVKLKGDFTNSNIAGFSGINKRAG
jgi:hypothetical protein